MYAISCKCTVHICVCVCVCVVYVCIYYKESFHKCVALTLRCWKNISEIDYINKCFALPTIYSLLPSPSLMCYAIDFILK